MRKLIWQNACASFLVLAMISAVQGEEPANPCLSLFDGETLEGWEITTVQDFTQHGSVEVEEGAIHLAAGQPASGIRYTGEIFRNDYEISFEARRDEGSDFFCGLTFPVDEEYLSLIVGGWGGSIVGLSNLNGASASENDSTTDISFENGTWYKISLRVFDNKIRLRIDDEEIFNIDIEDRNLSIWWEQEPLRPLGICSWCTSASLRNISMVQIDAEEENSSEVEESFSTTEQPRRRIPRRRRRR